MAKPELGTKRVCQTCATKFYDLHRDPILCPKCGATFILAASLLRPRADAKAAEEEDDLPLAGAADFVPLEAVDAEASGKEVPDDLEIEDAGIETDDTFLEPEEDEDDGDVAGLIDGDLEEDEES